MYLSLPLPVSSLFSGHFTTLLKIIEFIFILDGFCVMQNYIILKGQRSRKGNIKRLFRPGSNAVLHMSRTQFKQLGSCEVRRLTQLSSTDFIWSG